MDSRTSGVRLRWAFAAVLCLLCLGLLSIPRRLGSCTISSICAQDDYSGVASSLSSVRKFMSGTNSSSSGAGMSAEAYYELAKLSQEMFCRDAHPLETPGVVAARIKPFPVIMYLYRNGDVVSDTLLHGNQWEAGELKELLWALEQPLPKGFNTSQIGKDLFVDIGANVGAFLFATAARGYEVVAFEGMRSNQRLIRSGLCASDPSVSQRVTLHGFGLGAQPATCYIFSDPGNQGDGITMCDAANAEEAAKKAGSYVVRGTMQVHTLDSVLKRDVKAMKIDVEGFEPLVLRGAKRLLEEHRVWYLMVEFNTVLLRGNARKPEEFVMELTRLGYSISSSSFNGPYLSPAELLQLGNGKDHNTNLFCVHPLLRQAKP
ncbi:S-adenosyl-L-methionine-dependent methyltransferase [Haematococcus lacustris]